MDVSTKYKSSQRKTDSTHPPHASKNSPIIKCPGAPKGCKLVSAEVSPLLLDCPHSPKGNKMGRPSSFDISTLILDCPFISSNEMKSSDVIQHMLSSSHHGQISPYFENARKIHS
jgi:hypothetical protein